MFGLMPLIALAVLLCAQSVILLRFGADALAQAAQPCPGPRKLQPEYRQAKRNEDQCRTRGDDHNHANDQNRATNECDDDSSGHFVSNV